MTIVLSLSGLEIWCFNRKNALLCVLFHVQVRVWHTIPLERLFKHLIRNEKPRTNITVLLESYPGGNWFVFSIDSVEVRQHPPLKEKPQGMCTCVNMIGQGSALLDGMWKLNQNQPFLHVVPWMGCVCTETLSQCTLKSCSHYQWQIPGIVTEAIHCLWKLGVVCLEDSTVQDWDKRTPARLRKAQLVGQLAVVQTSSTNPRVGGLFASFHLIPGHMSKCPQELT